MLEDDDLDFLNDDENLMIEDVQMIEEPIAFLKTNKQET